MNHPCHIQIEGSLFIVKRSFGVRFRLVVLNRINPTDLEQVGPAGNRLSRSPDQATRPEPNSNSYVYHVTIPSPSHSHVGRT